MIVKITQENMSSNEPMDDFSHARCIQTKNDKVLAFGSWYDDNDIGIYVYKIDVFNKQKQRFKYISKYVQTLNKFLHFE